MPSDISAATNRAADRGHIRTVGYEGDDRKIGCRTGSHPPCRPVHVRRCRKRVPPLFFSSFMSRAGRRMRSCAPGAGARAVGRGVVCWWPAAGRQSAGSTHETAKSVPRPSPNHLDRHRGRRPAHSRCRARIATKPRVPCAPESRACGACCAGSRRTRRAENRANAWRRGGRGAVACVPVTRGRHAVATNSRCRRRMARPTRVPYAPESHAYVAYRGRSRRVRSAEKTANAR